MDLAAASRIAADAPRWNDVSDRAMTVVAVRTQGSNGDAIAYNRGYFSLLYRLISRREEMDGRDDINKTHDAAPWRLRPLLRSPPYHLHLR